jgi:hypothetical protein
MATNDVQNELLTLVQGNVPDNLSAIRVQLEQATLLGALQVQSLTANTDAVSQNTVAQSSGTSTASSIAKTTSSVLGLGLFLSPLVTGIAKLFGGGKSEPEPAPLVQYARPSRVSLQAAIGPGLNSAIRPFDYDQQGGVRRAAASGVTQNVTIQVQALDSRSIMDRSDDIARALREAMLNSHSVNGVVAEL